ncbi:hypothetical protein AEYBE204_09565 [Asticcacaulis sp. YBE204]|nr:hypothetical protein AEYBE204_09565 [Asticcacaulis sp. YBE204]
MISFTPLVICGCSAVFDKREIIELELLSGAPFDIGTYLHLTDRANMGNRDLSPFVHLARDTDGQFGAAMADCIEFRYVLSAAAFHPQS